MNQTAASLTVSAQTKYLEQVLAFIHTFLNRADCPAGSEMQITVAVEEIFVNIARYAYPEQTGKAVIQAELREAPRAITITFLDSGVRYNPLEKPDPDITLSVQEREIGGLGIFMTKKLMDEVSYEYRDGQNVFTMKKNL